MKESENEGRMVIIGGPSCVGKSPLAKSLKRLHPELMRPLKPIVLYNSRSPRPGEEDGVDYHFRSRKEIEKLRKQEGFLVMDVRSDLQALDVAELEEMREEADPFFEGNPYIARALQTAKELKDAERLSIFISPLDKAELKELQADQTVDLEQVVTDVMRRKLLRRTQKSKTILSGPDLEEIETRAGHALRELREAHHFQYVVPNHDGEDSDNWDAFPYLLGDARKTVKAVAALLAGESPPSWVEAWEKGVV